MHFSSGPERTAAVRVEAVVADLDGTLVRRDFSVSQATVEALELLAAARIPIVIATARTPSGVEYLSDIGRRAALAVCCSGTIGWSSRRKCLLWQDTLDTDTVATLVELATGRGAGVASFDGQLWRMTLEYGHFGASPAAPHGQAKVIVEAADIVRAPCCTVAVRDSPDHLEALASLLACEVQSCAISRGGTTLLDVTPHGVDKGTGTSRALALLGVTRAATIGFGDMPSDVPMLRAVGRAYAVGDASPSVVNAAHEVVEDVERDGFANKIAELADSGWRVE